MYNCYFRLLVTILFCVSIVLLPFSSKSDMLTMFFIFLLLAFMRMLMSFYFLLKCKLEEEKIWQKAYSPAEIEAELNSKKGLGLILCCGVLVLILALIVNWNEIFRNFYDYVRSFFN